MITSLAELFWTRLPMSLDRRLPLLGAILADGRYLLAWPPLAALGPIVAVVIGLFVGAARPLSDQLFTFAIAWPAALLAVGSLGAGLGFWAWLGFVLADFFIYPHVYFELDPVRHLVTERLPLVIMAEVLFALVVLAPVAIRSLPASITDWLAGHGLRGRASVVVSVALAAFVAAMTAASWSASAGVLVRPFATFHDGILGPQAVQPLRQLGSVLITVSVAGALVRRALELAAHRAGEDVPPIAPARGRPPSVLRQLIGALVASVLLTLGLAGVLNGPEELPILLAVVAASTVGRSIVLPRLSSYSRVVGRVPALLRVLAMGAIGYATGQLVTNLLQPDGILQVGWEPVLVTIGIVTVIATFLFPAAPAVARAGDPARDTAPAMEAIP
jgi:hypothetical protein